VLVLGAVSMTQNEFIGSALSVAHAPCSRQPELLWYQDAYNSEEPGKLGIF